MTHPQLDPEVARRVLREKYPYAWAYQLQFTMARPTPAFARATVRFAQAVEALRYAGRPVPCRLCGQAGGHHPGCLLGGEP